MSSQATRHRSYRWANLRMVGIHPIRGIDEITRFREHTAELPLPIRLWMHGARYNTFNLLMIACGIPSLIHPTPEFRGVFALIYLFSWYGYSLTYRTRFDVWTPIGFHVWKWMITVRA